MDLTAIPNPIVLDMGLKNPTGRKKLMKKNKNKSESTGLTR